MQVRPSSREVVLDGKSQILQPRVMQVLVALGRRSGEVVSRDDLVTRCWDGLAVSEDAISRCIGQLRKLAEEAKGQSFDIETVARVGYRLTASASLPSAVAAVGQAPEGRASETLDDNWRSRNLVSHQRTHARPNRSCRFCSDPDRWRPAVGVHPALARP